MASRPAGRSGPGGYADTDADRTRRGHGPRGRARAWRRRLSAEALRAARAPCPAPGDPAPGPEWRDVGNPALWPPRDRCRRAPGPPRRRDPPADGLPMGAAAGAGAPCRQGPVAGRADGPAQAPAAGGIRPLDRRPHLAASGRHRGRSEEASARDHGAGCRLCIRQGPGLTSVKRLYQKIYLTIIASLFVVVLVAGAIGRL